MAIHWVLITYLSQLSRYYKLHRMIRLLYVFNTTIDFFVKKKVLRKHYIIRSALMCGDKDSYLGVSPVASR